MRTLFFGTAGRFSAIVLAALLDAGIAVVGVVIAALPGTAAPVARLPLGKGVSGALALGERAGVRQSGLGALPNIMQLASAHEIPAYAVAQLGAPETLTTLAALHAEVGCVACFPHRLPPALLELPPGGVLNVHPSLLPALRGPEPLFWALRAGLLTTGVTIHVMDQSFDTGPIVVQGELPIADGMSSAELEARAARLGGQLLIKTLELRRRGLFPQRPQPAGGQYHSFPTASDFTLDPAWSARRAYNFMRGTATWAMPYPLLGSALLLGEALAYQAEASLAAPIVPDGDSVQVQFAPGVLRARAV